MASSRYVRGLRMIDAGVKRSDHHDVRGVRIMVKRGA